MYALKGPKMKYGVKGYETNFPLEHAQKDVRFAQALADDHGISMSVSGAANGMYDFYLSYRLHMLTTYIILSLLVMINRMVQGCKRSRVKQERLCGCNRKHSSRIRQIITCFTTKQEAYVLFFSTRQSVK